ncbi:MAG: potassium channel family protein [Alphaproteobacteria bacterium]
MSRRRGRIIPAVRLPAYGSLLAANFLIMLLMPLFVSMRYGLLFERGLSAVMLVAAFVATGMPRADAWKLLFGIMPFLVMGSLGDERLENVAVLGRTALLVWAEYRILRQFLAEQVVGWDTVAAAATGFVVIGSIWGDLFLLLERWHPGSFMISPAFDIGSDRDPRAALAYFSFVTLTTVGYGEIAPANVGSGGLSVSEALIGQLYLAVMISRMVGLHLAGSRSSTDGGAAEG